MSSVRPNNIAAFNCILIWLSLVASSTVTSLHFECDAISNTDFGRRFCFFRHMYAADNVTNSTILPNDIADEKRELIFDNCTLYSMPRGIFQQFPHIKIIYAWHSQLKSLDAESFHLAAELTTLDVSRNVITLLTARTFIRATNLMRLEMSYNHVSDIDADAFVGLDHLHTLLLDNNRLEFVPGTAFTPLRQLKTIRLDHNAIKTVAVEQFIRNVGLQSIHLNDNAIEWMLGEHTFRHLSHVIEFDLHNNPITNLRTLTINAQTIDIRRTNAMGCFVGARTKRLLASDNRITSIDTRNGSVANLQYVDLANNRLDSIQNLTHFDGLTHLDVSLNRIVDIGLNTFANMTHIEYLNLRQSGFNRIYYGSFSHKLQLKTLDVAFNGLQRIDFHMLVPMPSLRHLHVDGNNLTNIDVSEVRKLFPALKSIGVSMNDWYCGDLAVAIKYLESNGVTLETDGVIRNTENIKGVPCQTGARESQTVHIAGDVDVLPHTAESVQHDVSNITPESIAQKTHAQIPTEQCKSNQKNIVESEAFLRLIDLKYQTLNTIESVQSISNKLENIISQLQLQ